MVPFFQYNQILLGPIAIQVWGVFVSLGIAFGLWFSYRLAQKYTLSGNVIIDIAFWAVLGAFIMARVFHIVFYEPVYYTLHPQEIFMFWQGGASSLGGFVGAGLAVYIFAKARHFSLKELLPYFDIASIGLWLGWGIGRLGCFFIHDHPGRLSNFWLAVNFPTGSRYDLGLYESLLAFILFIIFYLLFKKLIKIHWGLVFGLSFICYAVVRFFLDFLRATDLAVIDVRYFNLTPAQWGMMVIILGLTATMIWSKMMKREKKLLNY